MIDRRRLVFLALSFLLLPRLVRPWHGDHSYVITEDGWVLGIEDLESAS